MRLVPEHQHKRKAQKRRDPNDQERYYLLPSWHPELSAGCLGPRWPDSY